MHHNCSGPHHGNDLCYQVLYVQAGPWNAFCLAVMYTALVDYDKAFEWVNWEPHHAFTAWVAVMPEFFRLYDDPRFKDFLERLNLTN